MKKPTLMMIGGGIQQIRAVEIAQANGYRVLVTDRSPDAPCFSRADFTAVIEGRDIEGLIAHAVLHQQDYNICAVFTLTELVTSVAAVNQALGLAGASVLSAVKCQNKVLSKTVWLDAGVSTPRGGVAHSAEEALSIMHDVPGPHVLKPSIGFGGKGLVRVSNPQDVQRFDFAQSSAIVEEDVDGHVHDVNAIFLNDGTFVPLGAFDRTFDLVNQVETGACYPSRLDAELVQQAYTLTEHAARALGIDQGPVKSDLILSKDGFKILELAPRLHGPKGTLYLSALVDGKGHLERVFDVMTSQSDLPAPILKTSTIGAYQIIEHPGKPFSSVSGTEAIQAQGFEVLVLNDHSDHTHYRDTTEAIGYIFGKGDDFESLSDTLKSVARDLVFKDA